ncbi:MAG: hypothetical protein KGM15_02340 [Pseudomonadota bacterium]|nr:hypothetical protein [Pseudomonadota bacterium]
MSDQTSNHRPKRPALVHPGATVDGAPAPAAARGGVFPFIATAYCGYACIGAFGDVGVINQARDGYLDLALNVGKPATYLAGLAVLQAMLRGAPLWSLMVVVMLAPARANS